MAAIRGLAIDFYPADPGRCAAIEIVTDTEQVDAVRDMAHALRELTPAGEPLELPTAVLGRYRVVNDCEEPGTVPVLTQPATVPPLPQLNPPALLCPHHAACYGGPEGVIPPPPRDRP
jgi:hypothetical protein